jgi:hypothetical protein
MTRIRHVCPKFFTVWGPACAGALALTACATGPAPAAQEPARSQARIETGTSAGANVAWERRGEPAELAKIIAQLAELTAQHGDDRAAWLKLAEARCLMADSILVLGWKDQGEPSAHFEAAESAALSALGDGADAQALRERGYSRLDKISEDSSSALYWFARSAYERARLAGYQALLLDHAVLAHAMNGAAIGAPKIDGGGPDRWLASFAAHPPDPASRDLPRAKERAERALSVAPKHPANLLAYIEHYAVPAQDRAAIADKLQQLTEMHATTAEEIIALARATKLAASIEDGLE